VSVQRLIAMFFSAGNGKSIQKERRRQEDWQ